MRAAAPVMREVLLPESLDRFRDSLLHWGSQASELAGGEKSLWLMKWSGERSIS
jgi:hypothetical protein